MTVHPRSRGEHIEHSYTGWLANGSSPLARGTRQLGYGFAYRVRFIPARAGNTARSSSGDPVFPVHPRSRGEHYEVPDMAEIESGSSPLARGTLVPSRFDSLDFRFIPARAGNTMRTRYRAQQNGGSSPLARGTHALTQARTFLDRFIPARAGNTCLRRPKRCPETVHPRSRGEHGANRRNGGSMIGSSPLARGTPAHGRSGVLPRRFIPARAGNTALPIRQPPSKPVHPRSRGEHGPGEAANGPTNGSSPLARGTRTRSTGTG